MSPGGSAVGGGRDAHGGEEGSVCLDTVGGLEVDPAISDTPEAGHDGQDIGLTRVLQFHVERDGVRQVQRSEAIAALGSDSLQGAFRARLSARGGSSSTSPSVMRMTMSVLAATAGSWVTSSVV